MRTCMYMYVLRMSGISKRQTNPGFKILINFIFNPEQVRDGEKAAAISRTILGHTCTCNFTPAPSPKGGVVNASPVKS